MLHRRLVAAIAIAMSALFGNPALAASTINPTVPAQNSTLSSSVLRNNFAAAYNDVNSILGMYAGSTAPVNPFVFQQWADTSTSPNPTTRMWDGTQWVETGSLDQATHVYTPVSGATGTVTSVICGTGLTGGTITASGTCALDVPVSLAHGGTGGTDQASARSGLGLGTAAVQATGTSGANVPLLNGANTWSGAQGVAAAFTAAQDIYFSGAITPTTLSGNVDNYAPTGIATASAIRINGGAADRNITGLLASTEGRLITLQNIGTSNSLILKEQSSSSTSTNRFALGADLTVIAGGVATVRYDGTSGRWRLYAGGGSSGGSGTVTSVATGTGLTGGTITSTGTISLASVADQTLLANVSGVSAAPTPTSVSTLLDTVFSNARGALLQRGASGWAAIAPGTVGTVLTSGGAGADNSWIAAPSGNVPTGGSTGQALVKASGADYDTTWSTVSGTGTVVGPVSATNTAIARWDGTSGTALLNSGVLLDGSNNITGVASIRVGNTGLTAYDSDATSTLAFVPGSNLTSNHTLTFVTGDADRSLTLPGDATVSGTNTGDQTITLSGAVSGTGTGAVSTSFVASAISSVAGLTPAADRLPYYTGASTAALATFTAQGRSLVAGSTAAAQRDTLGLGVSALVDGPTPALDASLGSTFTLSSTTNPTIAVPSNPANGQKIVIRFTASGADRSLGLNTASGGFRYGDDVTGLTPTPSGTTDYIGAIYNSSATFWDVVAYAKGF